MKKFLLLLAGIAFAFAMNAQALLSEDFESYASGDVINQNGWFTLDTVANDTILWKVGSYNGNFAKITAYHNDTAHAFLFTPTIDLTSLGASDEVNLYFDVAVGYFKAQQLKVFAVTNLGDSIPDTLAAVKSANYDLLQDSFPNTPTNTYGPFQTYNINLNNYKGQVIRIAFYYEAVPSNATTYEIDNVKLTTYAVSNINYVYTMNDTTLVVKYANKLDVFDPAQFSLKGSNFGLKSIDLNDSLNVYVYTDTIITFDNVLDTIKDDLNQTTALFYAGTTSIDLLNEAVQGGPVENGASVKIQGYVTANDDYNQVWIQDDTATMHGVLVYDANKDLPGMVKVGDFVTLVGTRSVYKNLTEVVFKELLNDDSTVNSPIQPMVIPGSAIGFTPGSTDQPADDPNIEPYEGLLVQVQNVVFLSGPTSYYEYIGTDDNGATNFVVDDEVDYHWSSYDTISLHGVYNVTGVVTYGYGYYRLNALQKAYNGLEYLHSTAVNDVKATNMSVYPNPVYNELNITAQSNINKVEVFNAMGQAVKSVNINASNAAINMADLQPGVYMIRVYTSKGISTSKIIKR